MHQKGFTPSLDRAPKRPAVSLEDGGLSKDVLFSKNPSLNFRRFKKRSARFSAGFTLIELLTIIGIMAVIGSIGALSIPSTFREEKTLDLVAKELLANFRDAQQKSISQDQGSQWGVYIDAAASAKDSYKVYKGNDYAAGTVIKTVNLPATVEFFSPSQGFFEDIIFEKVTGDTSSRSIILVLTSNNSIRRYITIGSKGLIGSPTGGAPAYDFSIFLNPSSRLVLAGQPTDITVNVALISGSPQQTDFSASNLPSGVTASFNPANCTPSLACFSVLTLATSFSTPAGATQIPIAAVTGTTTRTANFTLIVSPVSDTIITAINPTSGYNSTSVSLISITGTGFVSGATVKLTKTGQSDITCTGTTVASAISITGGSCPITSAATGAWNVVVTNTDTGTGSLINGFTVNAITVPDAPTIGTATAGNAQATVTFTAPASDGGSAITGYTVTSNPGGLTGTGSASPITVTGLTNGTAYTFTVTATNIVGIGPASAASNSVTPATVPNAPQSLAATASDMQISLSWTAPSSDGGSSITNYKVYRGTTSGGETFLIELGNVLTYVDSSVTNGLIYYYKVSAKNSAGEGSKSNESYQLVWDRTTTAAAWPARSQNSSIAFGDSIFLMGGKKTLIYNDVWSSGDGITWYQQTAAANWSIRYSLGLLNYKNKLWVLGGRNASANLNDVWYSGDGIDWTQATASANWGIRQDPMVLVYDGKMWVMGGIDGVTKRDVWYSTDGANWTQATASASWPARVLGTAMVYDGKMWVMGGWRNSSTYLNDVWYSTDGANWTEATASAGWGIRYLLSSGVRNNTMWVMGGYNGSYLNDVWSSTDGANWTQITPNAAWSIRGVANTVIFDNKLWVIGGKISTTEYRDVWNTQTSVTPPSAPLLAAAPGDTQIILSWSAPSNGGSYITGYKIYRGATPGGEIFLTEIGNVSTYTDTGLTNGSTYYYKVSAINSNGEGALSSETKGYPGTKRAFVTSARYYGNLGGLSGADLKCQTSADAVPLGGAWKAWLSSSVTSASSRLSHESTPYKMVNGTLLANNWADLVDGSIANPFVITEYGSNIGSGSYVFTNTNGDGSITSTNLSMGSCNNWTSSSVYYNAGNTTYTTNGDWTDGSPTYYCTNLARLYCFEQGSAVGTPPSTPLNLVATPGDSQTVLTWTAPSSSGGSAITNYKIYRGTTPGGESLVATIGNLLTYTNTGLTFGNTYYYKISAVNTFGEGPQSAEVNSVFAAAPSVPLNFVATTGNQQITLTWSAPSSNGGSSITNYEIYRGMSSGNETFLTEVGNVLTYVNTGLTNGTTYYYKVAAKNPSGIGSQSNEANAVSATVPGAPTIGTATPGNAQVTVAFTAPASDGGSAITGYTVTSNPGGLTGTGSASPITVTGLTNGTAYTFTVTATNVAGTGSASAASNSVTSITTCLGCKYAFVTSSTYNGNLSGLTGADAKCAARATAGGLTGTYKAWLSIDSVAAGSRLSHSSVPYKRIDGVTVASNWADLIDGTLSNAINLNEYGSAPSVGTWTNTQTNGSATGDADCVNWTIGDKYNVLCTPTGFCYGSIGFNNQVSAAWTYAQYEENNCNNALRLYCFEQ